jgi:hypothetical protein
MIWSRFIWTWAAPLYPSFPSLLLLSRDHVNRSGSHRFSSTTIPPPESALLKRALRIEIMWRNHDLSRHTPLAVDESHNIRVNSRVVNFKIKIKFKWNEMESLKWPRFIGCECVWLLRALYTKRQLQTFGHPLLLRIEGGKKGPPMKPSQYSSASQSMGWEKGGSHSSCITLPPLLLLHVYSDGYNHCVVQPQQHTHTQNRSQHPVFLSCLCAHRLLKTLQKVPANSSRCVSFIFYF